MAAARAGRVGLLSAASNADTIRLSIGGQSEARRGAQGAPPRRRKSRDENDGGSGGGGGCSPERATLPALGSEPGFCFLHVLRQSTKHNVMRSMPRAESEESTSQRGRSGAKGFSWFSRSAAVAIARASRHRPKTIDLRRQRSRFLPGLDVTEENESPRERRGRGKRASERSWNSSLEPYLERVGKRKRESKK